MDLLKIFKGKITKEKIVKRLLDSKAITLDEAVILIDKTIVNINVDNISCSTGGTVSIGSNGEKEEEKKELDLTPPFLMDRHKRR